MSGGTQISILSLILLVVTTLLFRAILNKSTGGISHAFQYILRGQYGLDFCSMPFSREREMHGSMYYEDLGANPGNICGPLCEEEGQFSCILTARKIDNITFTQQMTREDRAASLRKHSSGVVKSVLSPSTAAKLRKIIYEESERDRYSPGDHTQVFILEPEARWQGMPHLEDAIVRRALREIGEHPIVRPLLEDVVSPRASLVSFSAIRADYGSTAQTWHSDAGLIKTPYGFDQPFVHDFFSLSIALQDVTEGMGETGVCPGVHTPDGRDIGVGESVIDDFDGGVTCWYHDPIDDLFESGSPDDMCIRATLGVGDGLFFKGDVYHRGSDHVDPEAEERINLFVLFMASKEGSKDTRMPVGSEILQMGYAQRFQFWGLDISTLKWLDVPFGLWRLTHAGILAWAYLQRVGSALRWWTISAYHPLTYLDIFCLVRYKGHRCESWGSDNSGNGFYLETLEELDRSWRAIRHVVEIIVWLVPLLAGLAGLVVWLVFLSILVVSRIRVGGRKADKGKQD